NQSGRCIAAYVYCSAGVHESTTDLVFGGHCLIAENGNIIAESERFQRNSAMLSADVDIDRLRTDRSRTNPFSQYPAHRAFRRVAFDIEAEAPEKLRREIDPHPFVPRGESQLRERCEEIFHTQVAGLAKRLEHMAGGPTLR